MNSEELRKAYSYDGGSKSLDPLGRVRPSVRGKGNDRDDCVKADDGGKGKCSPGKRPANKNGVR